MRAIRAWAMLLGGVLASAAGCLVVTPLDDLPSKAASVNRGGASQASAGEAGSEQGGSLGVAGKTAQSGSGGTTSGECKTNAECVKSAADEPYRCRPSDHTCVSLRSEACPLVVGEVADPNAVYFGAFATLDGPAPEDNPVVWAHQLALKELNSDNVGGLPDGPLDKRRPLVMVVCDNTDALVEPAMQHLAEEVQVPAVIGTLKPGDLRRAFETYAKRDIFYLSPVSVTTSVLGANDAGHIWNLLGQPSDFVPTYVALLDRSQDWLREDRPETLGRELRVVLVTTGDAFDSELRDALVQKLRFNGKSVTDNGSNFLSVEIDADNVASEALAIAKFAPDIVISAASELFVMNDGLQQLVEDEWAISAGVRPRPFYILSPYNAGDVTALTKRISGKLEGDLTAPEDQRRYVGVSIASAVDTTLQNAYGLRLRSLFKDAITDTANYYDATYYLAYAMYGANEPDGLTGSGIARGMQRLLTGESFKVGPTAISASFAALRTPGATIHVASTLGPPELDPKTGVRPVDGSVFCFKRVSTAAKLVPDALRYDRDAGALVGNFSACNPDF